MANRVNRQEWIREWIAANACADALNLEFHEAYHKRFPEYRRKETFWGAQMVYQAQKDLSEMYAAGILSRGRLGLSTNWQPGFPKWVWAYMVKKEQP